MSQEPHESKAAQALHAVGDAFHAAVDKVEAMIAKIVRDDPAEVAAVDHELEAVAEAGLVAAEPALAAMTESAVHAGVEAGAVAIEGAVPVLAPAVEAGAAAVDKAADHVIESEFAHLAKAPSDAASKEAK